MPVRSKKLLAGAAALVGLCVGGAGCHTADVRDGCYSTPAGVYAPGPVVGYQAAPAGAVASIQRPVRRPLFGGAAETAVASAPAAAALRPVPAGAMTGGDNSTWSPVQRVSAEGQAVPVDTGFSRVVTIDRPTPIASAPPVTGAELGTLPAPGPMPTGADDPPKKDEPKADKEKDKKDKKKGGDTLPSPRKSPGYPELPAVGITHPVEAPREFNKRSLSAYIIEPPDVLVIEAPADLLTTDKSVVLGGPALVRPDGTIGLGPLGSVFVAGMTIDQAKERIARVVQTQRPNDELDVILKQFKVDVAAFNSKFYYVVSDGAGYGAQITRVPITGNETVLDALAQIQGLPAVSSKKKIWLARATPHGYGTPHIMPIDYCSTVMRGSGSTNYQMFPGDRLYIESDRLLNFNSALGKVLAPVERILGVTLLGSGVVNSIRNGGNNNAGNNTPR
ncbi:MAG: polysaccharide biosynthesis/export family protein [Gemmataceae bacterium]